MEMEVSKLNGYTIKDKKAIRFYQNVESMKSDETLKNGMIVQTAGYYSANDGGAGNYLIRTKLESDIEDLGSIHFISESLVAELIIDSNTNLLTLGGKKEDVTFDNSVIVNNVINKKESYNKIVIPEGSFTFLNPINITKPMTYLKCDGEINYTGDDSAINISDGSNSTYDIYSIKSKSKAIKIENPLNRIFNLEFKLNKIYSEDNCLYINGINPVFQVNFKCFECGSVTNGERQPNIYFTIPSTSNNSYVNEINILDSIIFNNNENYGIKCVNLSSTSEIQYNMNGGSLENTIGVYSEGKVSAVSFNHVRLAEFFDRTFLKIKGEVGRYAFSNIVPLHNDFIDWSEAEDSYCKIFSNSGYRDKVYEYTHYGECILSNQCVIPQHFYSKFKTLTGSNITIDNVYTQGLSNVYEINTNDGDVTLKLDGHVFSGAFINEMRLLNYGDNAHLINIVDQNDKKLATLPKGRYLLLFGGSFESPTIEYMLPDRRNVS